MNNIRAALGVPDFAAIINILLIFPLHNSNNFETISIKICIINFNDIVAFFSPLSP